MMASVDGDIFRIMGPPDLSTTSLSTPTQTSVTVNPTTTYYVFDTSSVQLNVTFTTPVYDLDDDSTSVSATLKDLPITYLTVSTISLDGDDHEVDIYFDTSAESAVKNIKEEVRRIYCISAIFSLSLRSSPSSIPPSYITNNLLLVASLLAQVEMSRSSSSTSFTTLSVGTTAQDYLSSNDDRISWGYQSVSMLNNPTLSTTLSSDVAARTSFADSKPLPDDDSNLVRDCNDNWPVLALSFSLTSTPTSPSSDYLLLSFDEVQTMDYFGTVLEPFWKSIFPETEDMISYALSNYDAAIAATASYDAAHIASLSSVGGPKYASLLSLIHRQVTGGLAKTLSPSGDEVWMWMKEISSDGDISTVDVIYPAAPFFLHTSPETLRRMFLPLLVYSANATGADEVRKGKAATRHQI
jgi:hypothetical protein